MGWEQSTLLLRTLESEDAITQESRNRSGRPQLRPAARGPAWSTCERPLEISRLGSCSSGQGRAAEILQGLHPSLKNYRQLMVARGGTDISSAIQPQDKVPKLSNRSRTWAPVSNPNGSHCVIKNRQ